MRRMEVDLSPDERRELEHIVKHKRDARMVKRAQALLWLNEGEKITVITHRLQVRRRTVYNWRKMYNVRNKEPMRHRLQDRDRLERPPANGRSFCSWMRDLERDSPLRAVWGRIGEQTCVPITGNRKRLADCDAMSSKMC